MAMKSVLADAPNVDSVKEAVKSTSTCTQSTVSSLQSLLRCPSPVTEKSCSNNNNNNKLTKSSSATSTVTRTRSTRSARPKTTKATISQSSADCKSDDGLSVQERLVLATEVFNAASKALSDALASQKSPLKSASPNQIVSTPTKSKTKKATGESSVEGVISVAECASVALANLRSLKNDKAEMSAYPNLQLEQGACVLAGRLIALGLNKLAYRELRGLKKRLQDFLQFKSINAARNTSSRPADSAQREAQEIEQSADLLVFQNIENAPPILNVLVPFQTTVLKLIVSEAKLSSVAKTCDAVTMSNPSNPADIILRSSKAGILSKDKAALQMLSLSNTILTLSSLLQKMTGSDPSSAKHNAKSQTILTLQLCSLESRLLSWELSGHVAEQKREFWDPLFRFLDAFSKSGLKISKSDFVTIYTTVQRLKSKAKTDGSERMATPWRINLAVGRIAQDASCFEEALKLFSNAIDSAAVEQPLAISVIQCRVALIHLRLYRNKQGYPLDVVSKSLSAAAAGLKSSNKGSAHDLEELVVESAKLRKLAMAVLGESFSSGPKQGDVVINSTLEFVHAFVRFLRRYIGRQVPDEDEDKSHAQLQAVLCRMRTIILAAVDSVVALGKASILRQVPQWDNLQPVLSDSRRLLSNFENVDEKISDDETNWTTAIVRLSNVYWSRYLKEKEAGRSYRELIPLLDQSASLLQNCPATQRIAGFAALKLERLGHLYLEARMSANSVLYLGRSIQEHIDAGVLQQHMDYLAGRPPINTHDSQSPGFILTRVISSYLRVQIRRPETDERSVYDNEALSAAERGTLFEWQMAILADSHSHEADTTQFRDIFQQLVSKLLHIYSAKHYPVRRLRVIRFVLRFVLDHPNSIDNAVAESLVRDAELNMYSHSALEEDLELESFLPHIQNSLTLAVAFHKGEPELDELRDIVSTWASTMRKCSNSESLGAVIDDRDHWIAQMKALSDYLDARGHWKLYLATSEIILHVLELQPVLDESSILLTLSRCALQYCRRGDCKTSIELLDRARQYVDSPKISVYASVSYHLARSEQYLEIGDTDSSEQSLVSAQHFFQSRGSEGEMSGNRNQSRIGWERLVVDGTLLLSQIAFQRHDLKTALYYAKLSVRLSMRLWAKLERLSDKSRQSDQLATKEVSEMELVVDGVANLDIGAANTSPCSFTEGALYWNHVASHNACFLNLMRLSAYNGLFQDAIYYGEQALKVNKALGASYRLITCQAELGLEWVRGNHFSEAKEILRAATELSGNLVNSIEMVKLKISLAALSRAQGEHQNALQFLQEAGTLLDRVSEVKLDSSLLIKSLTGLEGKMANLKIRQASVQKESELLKTRRTTRRTRTLSKSAAKEESDTVASSIPIHSQTIVTLRNEIVRQQIHNLLAIQDLDEASRVLETARESPFPTASQISIRIEEIEHIVADAMRSIATHAVYCVLPESTLSLPSIEAVIEAMKSPAKKQAAPAKRSRSTVKRTRCQNTNTSHEDSDIASIMSHAKNAISETVKSAIASGSTIEGHAASCLMGRISMLLHATAPGLVDKDILTPVNANELGRITAFDRERLAINIDKRLSDFADATSWPSSMSDTVEEKPDIIANFSRDYVDILPTNWNVLSISLNSDRTEFIISRMRHGDTPFLLRLPLKRGDEGDEDEEEFTFDCGKKEMKEIIKLANASAHDAKNRIDRQSKKEWWATRETLDRRLETLLGNMENIWLGGFRGIFDPTPRDSKRLSQFAKSFEAVLDKHLPSRRKPGDKKEKIKIHENVLGLFVGLRDLDKQENPEDSLTDLLYFVVDILQFQGERNAYDEIDFDMMVIDTLDALNVYKSNAPQTMEHPNHTILVLDKSLHSFPWESLPCLQGLPISRMPSLECLRQRINQFRTGTEEPIGSFYINRSNGSSILNPSGDLKTTQSAFEKKLSELSGWSSIVKRAPSEQEFKSALEDKDIFLYFGHGSGAQYIRGRTIKRLDRCAVTFLMGCSSGCLTETGELEPYGTPMNYMQAGSPALVATLWDVTDKDIDRFANSTLEKWGLLEPDTFEFKENERRTDSHSKKGSRGKELSRAESFSERSRALDEAIAASRESCLLKYLNGAAPVIYGIPVHLRA